MLPITKTIKIVLPWLHIATHCKFSLPTQLGTQNKKWFTMFLHALPNKKPFVALYLLYYLKQLYDNLVYGDINTWLFVFFYLYDYHSLLAQTSRKSFYSQKIYSLLSGYTDYLWGSRTLTQSSFLEWFFHHACIHKKWCINTVIIQFLPCLEVFFYIWKKMERHFQFIVFKLHFLTITRVKQTIYISTKRNFGTWE